MPTNLPIICSHLLSELFIIFIGQIQVSEALRGIGAVNPSDMESRFDLLVEPYPSTTICTDVYQGEAVVDGKTSRLRRRA